MEVGEEYMEVQEETVHKETVTGKPKYSIGPLIDPTHPTSR